MKLVNRRLFLGNSYTIGKLSIDGKYFCDTIEDKVRDINKNGIFDNGEHKVYAETAIPYGLYKVVVSYSPKFKRMLPEILDVNNFTGIRIHRGNTAKDSAGCLIVGFNRKKGMVLDSTICEEKLVKILTKAQSKNEDITIEII